jgi:hypothetical protein
METPMESQSRNGPSDPSRHRGPPLLLLAGVYVVVFLAGLVVPAILSGGQHIPSPFGPAELATPYFVEHTAAARVGALLQFGSAIPFGIFAATATSRVQFLGIKSVARLFIALFGGFLAAGSLLLSAMVQWALVQCSTDLTAGTIHVLHYLQFAAGGPGYAVPFGLFVSGIALTAGIQRFAPRWLMFMGLAIALTAELSWLAFVLPPAAFLLPVARFTGFAWLIAIAVVLPKSRSGVTTRGASPQLVQDTAQA